MIEMKGLKKATKEIEELRRKVDNGELDLSEYEKIANGFEEKGVKDE